VSGVKEFINEKRRIEEKQRKVELKLEERKNDLEPEVLIP
jgi:hypothetical protein